MDDSIAFIIPNSVIAASTERLMKKLGLSHPVYVASLAEALKLAKSLSESSNRIIVSHGITGGFLRTHTDIPILDIPFSGIEVAKLVKEILKQTDKRIAHVGTPPLFTYLLEGLRLFDIDERRVAHFFWDAQQPAVRQVQRAVDSGFEVFVSGYEVVTYVRKLGYLGYECDVDEQTLMGTILNAQNVVNRLIAEEKEAELSKAILEATSDGIITVDESRKILSINRSARRIAGRIKASPEGLPLESFLEDNRLVNISEPAAPGIDFTSATPIVLTEHPIVIHDVPKGSVISVKRVSDIQDLEHKIRDSLMARGLVAKNSFDNIICASPAMCAAKEIAKIYAKYDSTVLITGETGVGKELFAQGIHNASGRKAQPFVAINCAALPENLIESELFGYDKGAFTGANREGKVGLFELANNGTIFLDEIGELPLSVQAKLLRVIQDGEIIRIGGNRIIHVDTRIICASNRNILTLVEKKQFKDDLYYRISALEIHIPPLRERKEEIPLLAQSILNTFNLKYDRKIDCIDKEVMRYLTQLKLPGNVRELQNLIERLFILANRHVIDMETLERSGHMAFPGEQERPAPADQPQERTPGARLKDTEKNLIMQTLERCGGNKARAAKELGIDRSTLWRKLQSFER